MVIGQGSNQVLMVTSIIGKWVGNSGSEQTIIVGHS